MNLCIMFEIIWSNVFQYPTIFDALGEEKATFYTRLQEGWHFLETN